MFRAYADPPAGDREEGECDDDDRERYSSFDQEKILEARAKKESIAKAQRLAERIKNQNALRYINSDSDDDDVQIHVELPTPSHFVPISTPRIELPVEKKKKKKKSKTSKNRNHKNKKKKKQQRRRSSSSSSDSSEDNLRRTRERSCSDASSSSSDSEDSRNRKRKTPKVIIRRERWGFLGYREERSIEGSFIVFDHQYDHENFNMDAIPKGHTLDYRPRYFSIINGNSRLDELFFSKELREVKGKSKRSERYFDGVLRKLDDSLVERKFRRLPSLSEAGMDYVALSKTRLQEFEFLHQIAERKAAEKEREALEIEVAFSTPSHAIHLETRRRLLATEFANDKRNPHVLDQFLKINEEIFEASRISGTPLDRRALADRQLSIIDQAIASNQRAVEFRLKRLEYLKELRPRDDLLREWEQILNVFVNKCAVWAKYLDFIQYDSALYGKDVLERAFDRCFAKLTGLLGGTMKSHKLEANTENFLLDTYVRRLLWWMESGYSNRAIASVQATIEYNFLVPDSLNGSPEEKKREAFEKFWNSGVPRFGDEGARGWREFHKTLENLEEAQNREKIARALQEQKSNELEERVASSEDSLITSWVEMERELENIESRPRRPLPDTCANMSADHAMKVVTFKDIRIFKGAGVHVLLSLLHTLGAHFVDSLIYSVIDLSMQLPRLPTFRLLEEWDLLPSLRKLFPVPSPGAQDVVLDMIHAVVELQPEIVYVASLLETKASQIEFLYRDHPTGVCTSELRRFARHIAKKYQSTVNVKDFDFILAAYTLKIFGRWVRDEPKSQPSSFGNEGDRKKKAKKEGKQFTRSEYIEQLSALLSKSNNVPLVQQSLERLSPLLRTLLCLVQVLPHHRVLTEIARFFLRKGSDDTISPTDALSALDEWKNLFRTVDNFTKPQKISCFESARALCIALRIHFEYARASKASDQWVKDCGTLFKHSEQCLASDDRAVIVGAFLDVLEYHWKTYHTQKEKLLEVLEKGQILCPYDGSLIRRRINLSSGVMEKFRIQHALANAPTRNDPTLDMYSSLARLYLEKNRIAKLIEAGALPNSDVVATITRAEASQRRDPALWRLALAQAKSFRFLNETHVLASAQCGWSRHLHIDCVALSNSTRKCKEIMSLMEERGVYVFNDLDYMQELKSLEQMEL